MQTLADMIVKILASDATAPITDINATAESIIRNVIAASRSWHPELRREARDLVRRIKLESAIHLGFVTRAELLEYAEA